MSAANARSARCRGHLGAVPGITCRCPAAARLDNVTPPRRLIVLHSGATAMLILRAVAAVLANRRRITSKPPGRQVGNHADECGAHGQPAG